MHISIANSSAGRERSQSTASSVSTVYDDDEVWHEVKVLGPEALPWWQCGEERCGLRALGSWVFWLSLFGAVVALVTISWELHESGAEPHVVAWFSAGVFVCLAVPISVLDITLHLRYFVEPKLQMYVVRIMWMVPIYGIESWLSLRFKEQAIYIETARECYEGFVIYSFFRFLVVYLGDEDELAHFLRSTITAEPAKDTGRGVVAHERELELGVVGGTLHEVGVDAAVRDANVTWDTTAGNGRYGHKHIFPCCCLRTWQPGADFLSNCKSGILQYVVVKVATSLAIALLEWADLYGDGEFRADQGYVYITFVNNLSQCWALYCLVIFYQATKEALVEIHPLRKFLCVKLVIFVSWWQSVAIAILVQAKIIQHTVTYTTDDISRGLQNWLICVEMLFAAIAHHFSFSYRDFKNSGARGLPRPSSLQGRWHSNGCAPRRHNREQPALTTGGGGGGGAGYGGGGGDTCPEHSSIERGVSGVNRIGYPQVASAGVERQYSEPAGRCAVRGESAAVPLVETARHASASVHPSLPAAAAGSKTTVAKHRSGTPAAVVAAPAGDTTGTQHAQHDEHAVDLGVLVGARSGGGTCAQRGAGPCLHHRHSKEGATADAAAMGRSTAAGKEVAKGAKRRERRSGGRISDRKRSRQLSAPRTQPRGDPLSPGPSPPRMGAMRAFIETTIPVDVFLDMRRVIVTGKSGGAR